MIGHELFYNVKYGFTVRRYINITEKECVHIVGRALRCGGVG